MILSSGDRVAVIAPASGMRSADNALVGEAIMLLESWGLVPTICIENDRYMYLAGTDEHRLAAINQAFTDPDVRAVFCSRGGYGSQRLLRSLSFPAVAGERMLVGFSDVTAIHLAAQAHAQRGGSGLYLVHGPNVATRQLLAGNDDAVQNRADLKQLLFDPAPVTKTLEYLVAGRATGPLMGGCLSLIGTQVGTPFLPSFDEAILFVEDVGESPYRIDRMLHHLVNAGVLDRVAGLVFGVMHNCSDPYNDIRHVIVDVLDYLGVPIAFGLTSGHGPRNTAIPLGTTSVLDSRERAIHISHS